MFLGSAITLAHAGPSGTMVAYAIMGAVISSTMSCLGEMTALMPVNAPMMEFPRIFTYLRAYASIKRAVLTCVIMDTCPGKCLEESHLEP